MMILEQSNESDEHKFPLLEQRQEKLNVIEPVPVPQLIVADPQPVRAAMQMFKAVGPSGNRDYAQYAIQDVQATKGKKVQMRFKKWYSLVDQIHQKTTRKNKTIGLFGGRQIDTVFAKVDAPLLQELELKYQDLKVAKKNWSGRNAPETIQERARLFSEWLQAFKAVADQGQRAEQEAKWAAYDSCLATAKNA